MGVPEGCQTGSKTAKNGLFRPKADLVVPNWWNSVEQGWNKSGHIPGVALEPFWGSGRAMWVCQRAPKRVQNGQKQPFSAISGSGRPKKAPLTPVLKVDAHCAHVRRTKESWEDQKAG